MEDNPEGAGAAAAAKLVPTCLGGHPLKLGIAVEGPERYGRYDHSYCSLCGGSIFKDASSWRCQEDYRRGDGKCRFDVCEGCWAKYGADYFAAWPVIKKLAVLINLNNLQAPDEENYANFKSMIKPFPPQLVDRVEIKNREGNLLQYAVKANQKEYLQILLDYGLDPMAPRPRSRPSPHDVILSPLEDAIARGHMEVWNLLKDHVEMTVEMKLEQLYYMIVSSENRDRKEPYTVQFRELLSSVPIELVALISKGEPPVTRTLLQAAAQHGDKEAVQLLLQHGVDPKETSDEGRSPLKLAAEKNNDDILEILREAIGGEIPDDVKMLQLSKAIQEGDNEKFSELLISLSPELVSTTGIDDNGSLLQYAVLRSPDFIRPLLLHGVDPTVGSDTKKETPVEIAAEKASEYRCFLNRLTLFTEFVELPTEIKIKYVKLLVQSDEDHSDILQKQLQSLSDAEAKELAAVRVNAELHRSLCWSDVSLVQYLASQTGKSNQLQLLLNHGVDPRAATEEIDFTPLELAAINSNTEAFDLLAPHYEDNNRKKIAQLMIWGLTDSVPSAEFILLFKSVPLAEVNSCTIVDFNLLSYLARQDKTPHVAFLLEQGVDPDTEASPEKESPMRLACMCDNVATMAELAKYTEADEEVRSSDVWELVEKEMDRRWRKDGNCLLQKQQKQIEKQQKQIDEQQKQLENQSRLLKLVAKATGIEVEES